MEALTVSEAVALVGLEERTIRKEVEYGLFGSESPPRFDLPELVCLRVFRELGLQTTIEERRRIYAQICNALANARTVVELSPVLELKLAPVIAELSAILERFEQWKRARVIIDPETMGGEPVFAKTRLTVRHIGSMMLRDRADTLQEIREDYPYLSLEDIEFAKLYTVAYPKVGRPRAAKTTAR